MVTKSGIIGLVVGLAVVLLAVSMAGEESTKYVKIIETVDESGSNQTCVETGCYTALFYMCNTWSVTTYFHTRLVKT